MKTSVVNKNFIIIALQIIGFLTPSLQLSAATPLQAPNPSLGNSPYHEVDLSTEVAYPVGSLVDSYYQAYRELLPQRTPQNSHSTDHAYADLKVQDRFADRIAFAIETKMKPSRAGIGYVGSYYKLNTDETTYAPNSLISHPLCAVSATTLGSTLGSKKVPSSSTIKKANDFAQRMNEYRQLAIAGDRQGYLNALKLWTKLMMCTSYTESLTSADTKTSEKVAQRYSPSDYRRPAGVLFYEDPYQDATSRLNIGLFQFTPNAGGNVQACIREWNKLYPDQVISAKANQAEMIRILGSSLQTFNAFCGVAKVTGMFAVQINTTSASHTHPSNVTGGKIKSPADRCVSLHFAAGKSYNHFGPFQNSVANNLDHVLTCTLADL